jgi:glycerol-3-phosphate dehydrogenase
VTGAQARDLVGGTLFDVRARLVLNAAGFGIGPLLTAAGLSIAWPLQKAINLVVARPMSASPEGHPVAVASSHAGGTLIRIPWNARTIVGTWHSDSADAARSMVVDEAELAAVMADVNAAFPHLALAPRDVTLVHRGLVPAVAAGPHGHVRQQSQAAVLDHGADGLRGLLSIRGVKYTTGRLVAERAVDQVEQRLGRQPTPSRTRRTPLPGSLDVPPERLDHLARTYGASAPDVLALTRDDPSLADPIVSSHPAIAAEVVYAIRQELAQTLTDVIVRRIQMGAGGYPGDVAAARVAAVMQRECRWSEARVHEERRALREFYRPV